MRLSYVPVVGALATCLALSTTLTGSASTGSDGSPQPRAGASTTTLTPFGLSGSGYGSLVTGSDRTVNSGRSAYVVIGCTKLAGLDKSNVLPALNLEQADVSGVQTRTWTTREASSNGTAVSSRTMTGISSVDIGQLSLRGLRLTTRAFHDDRGFRTERDLSFTEASIGGVAMPQLLNPDTGATILVPGVGRVIFNDGTQTRSATGAQVAARALQVKLSGTDTTVTIGSATSRISNDVPAGVLGGYGRAANVRLVDGTVRSGKVAVQPLPCQGTGGTWRTNDTAGLDLPGVLEIGAASGSVRGDQVSRTNAYGQTRGRIARAEFGDRLVIGSVQAQANVTKRDGQLTKTSDGTSVGFIRVNGTDRNVPAAGETLTIRGLARISGPVVTRSEFGIRVTAAQVELLDGSIDNTVNLGEAFAQIRKG